MARLSILALAATVVLSLSRGVLATEKPGPSGFEPDFMTADGDTCEVAFGLDYLACREKSADEPRLCYNPKAGDACCNAKWACPAGSYCMPEHNYCCPDGVTVEECRKGASLSQPGPDKPHPTSGQTAPYPTGGPTATHGSAHPSGTAGSGTVTTTLPEFEGAAPQLGMSNTAAAVAGVALLMFGLA